MPKFQVSMEKKKNIKSTFGHQKTIAGVQEFVHPTGIELKPEK